MPIHIPSLKNLMQFLILILGISACHSRTSNFWSGNWTVYHIAGVPSDSINNGEKYFSRGVNMNIDESEDLLLLTIYSGDYVPAKFNFNVKDSTITISESRLNWLNNEFSIILDTEGSPGRRLDYMILYTDSIEIYARRELLRLRY